MQNNNINDIIKTNSNRSSSFYVNNDNILLPYENNTNIPINKYITFIKIDSNINDIVPISTENGINDNTKYKALSNVFNLLDDRVLRTVCKHIVFKYNYLCIYT